MDTLEGDGKDFEVILLVNSEPVKVLIVLSYMGVRVWIEYCAESKVLDSLEFGSVMCLLEMYV